MNQLEELQSLWQRQHVLTGEMVRYQDRQLRVNLLKTAAVIVLIGAMAWGVARHFDSPLVVVGLFWNLLSVIVFMQLYWRKQFRVSRLDFTAAAVDFLRAATEGLRDERRLFGTPFIVFAVSLGVGLNVMLYGFASGLRMHLLFSAELLVVAIAGLRIRAWRFRREQQPLVDRLIEAERDLAEVPD